MISSSLLSIIFPKICISCKQEGNHLCEDCLSTIQVNRIPSSLPRSSYLSGLFAATSYNQKTVQKAIQYAKYSPFIKDLAQPLASLIISHFALMDKPAFSSDSQGYSQTSSPFIICPIPLHKKRLKWRGYNQSEEIAKHLAKTLKYPICTDAIERIKNTKPQVELSEEDRRKNIKDAFTVRRPELVRKKKILLVDDVYTTGASMEECAKTLKFTGAKQVFGVVVARD